MNRYAWCGALGLLLGLTASGCSDECSSAFDCAQDEVCSNGICAPSLADYVRCNSDLECNDGNASGPFECIAGGCRLVGGGVVRPNPDGGTDAGMDGAVDSGASTPDTGTPDASVDAAMPDGGDAGMADGGDAGMTDASMTDGGDGGMTDGGDGGTGDMFSASVGGVFTDFSSVTNATFDMQAMEASILGQEANGDVLVLRVPGAFASTFACNAGASIQYARNGQTLRADMTFGSCTITVTGFGQPGMPVTGNFTATVVAPDMTQVILTNGQFNVTRVQ